MSENSDKLNQLSKKLEFLLKRQEMFSREINELRWEIEKLKYLKQKQTVEDLDKDLIKWVPETEVKSKPEISDYHESESKQENIIPQSSPVKPGYPSAGSKNIEKYIGENLTNKIGILITVIGVAIGAKYTIDHELISPLGRILLGYVIGIGLLGFGFRLKTKYENFSAVLVSGAMAIMYFITYFGYSLYHLMPQIFAFLLMVIFTVFTVLAALQYNRQVIAHIGLVGAYGIPFLLGDKSANVSVMFVYMAIINVGILTISIKKYWKPLSFTSFPLTWLIYLTWYKNSYQVTEHFGTALLFLTVFFAIFYITFLAYKLRQKEKFDLEDVLLLLANSFIFYGIGYSILNHHETGKHLLGIFTICNAVIHFIVSTVIYRQKLADRNLFYFVAGLVVVFLTISIPVQLNGHWVTILWAGEAALLFWIGRTKNTAPYESLSYALMLLAFISILQDWATVFKSFHEQALIKTTPLINVGFLSSLLFIGAFWFINILNREKRFISPLTSKEDLMNFISFSIPAILLFAIYYSFRIEISMYWHQLFNDSKILINSEGRELIRHNSDLLKFNTIWIIIYSILFFTVLTYVNLAKYKSKLLGLINLALNTLTILVFLTQGLYILSELRDSYLQESLGQYYHRGAFNVGIRYIAMAFVAAILFATYKYIREESLKKDFRIAFDLLFHGTILWIASSELIQWMDIAGSAQQYKFGLSILWGVYALILISLGIWQKKKYLRIAAITLFGVTLYKLFFYDISGLDTIAKTILFVSLGILLLIISFLYNKYRNIISDEN